MFRRVCTFTVCFALAAFIPSALAQAVYGSISGTVTDPSGGVLPGVTVSVTSVERKTVDAVVTNDSGQYVKDRLLPGAYEVKVELQGFKQMVYPGIQVNVDSQTRLDVALQVGALAEAVTVQGFSPLLKTDRADVATTFDSKQITDLPVLDRNFTKFVLLTPGTQQLGWQHAASENPQGSTQTMVNGQHFSGTGYQLDGTENRDPILGIIVINPTLESIAETKITSQNYDAEFGQATAGVVSVQTKSGGNQLRGSGFWFYQDDTFQSRNPFTQFQRDPLTGRFLPETTKNQFGASAGGKIVENKWFFFGDYESTRNTIGGSRLVTVPTDAARAGDFSAYGVDIFDPDTGAPAQRQQFGGNRIPTGRLSPQALALLQRVPTPNTAGVENGTINNYVESGSETFDGNAFNLRIDGRLRDGLNTFGRYSLGDFLRDGPQVFGEGGGDELVNLGGISDARNQSLAYGVDWAISSTLLADFRFGWFNYSVQVLPSDFGTTPAADAGIPGLNLDSTFASGMPAFFIGGDGDSRGIAFGSGLGDRVGRCNCPLDQDEKQFQLVGNVTKLLGGHSFKFGIDVRRAYNLRVPSDRHRSGELSFTDDRTRGPNGGGLALASFMLGDVSTFGRYVSPTVDARERQWRHFYYAQDTWRVNSKLTLNYGLRLDVINPQTVNEPGNGGFLDLDTGLIRVAGVGGIGLNGDVENTLQLGAARRPHLSDRPEDGDPRRLRPQLRHRRLRLALRPQRHPEPAGALDPAAQRAGELRPRLQPRRRSAAAAVPRGAGVGRVRAAGRRLRAGAAGEAAAAARRRLQHHRPARADADDVDRSRLRRQPRRQRLRRRRTRRSTSTRRRSTATRACRGTSAGPTSTSSGGRRTSTTSATAPRTPTTRCRRS